MRSLTRWLAKLSQPLQLHVPRPKKLSMLSKKPVLSIPFTIICSYIVKLAMLSRLSTLCIRCGASYCASRGSYCSAWLLLQWHLHDHRIRYCCRSFLPGTESACSARDFMEKCPAIGWLHIEAACTWKSSCNYCFIICVHSIPIWESAAWHVNKLWITGKFKCLASNCWPCCLTNCSQSYVTRVKGLRRIYPTS